jgi:hypothetical protein
VYTGGLAAHSDPNLVESLIRDVSPVYVIFRHAGPEAAPLVDLIISEKLNTPADFAQCGLLGTEALTCWAATARAAHPYRSAMQVVLLRFPGWWRDATPAQHQAMMAHLTQLAPAIGDLLDEGVRTLISAGQPSLACAASYALTTGDAVRAIVRIAGRGVDSPTVRDELLARLTEVFPAEKMEESRDAERFLPALERATAAAGDGWDLALRIGLQLAASDISSAYGTCLELPKAIAKAPAPRPYLENFLALVTALGNRSAGFCLKKLPQAQDAAAVEDVTRTAAGYGVEAGLARLGKML